MLTQGAKLRSIQMPFCSIGDGYADARHMNMSGICMFLSFFAGIRKIPW